MRPLLLVREVPKKYLPLRTSLRNMDFHVLICIHILKQNYCVSSFLKVSLALWPPPLKNKNALFCCTSLLFIPFHFFTIVIERSSGARPVITKQVTSVWTKHSHYEESKLFCTNFFLTRFLFMVTCVNVSIRDDVHKVNLLYCPKP